MFLYDDSLTIIFNTQDKQYDGKIPNINELECSFLGNDALPFSDYANIVYFVGGFAVYIILKVLAIVLFL